MLKLLLIPLFTISLPACAGKPTPNDWKSDCVGKMQLSFPSEVDVAVTPKEYLFKRFDLVPQSPFPRIKFDDNENAGWSHIYGTGISFVSEVLDASSIVSYKQSMIESIKVRQKNRDSNLDEPKSKVSLAKNTQTITAIQMGNVYDAISILNGRVVSWGAGGEGFSNDDSEKDFKEKQDYITPRNMYELPSMHGICLPYVFIKNTEGENRDIATTYRLKAHPDITVWLKDSSAAEFDTSTKDGLARSKHAEPEQVINSFWAQYEKHNMKVLSLWDEPRYYHSVKLAGQKGLATFMQIESYEPVKKAYHRPNEEITDYNAYYEQKAKEEYAEKHPKKHIDYGYFATARGNPKDNTPDLSFYLIQESSHAIAKGIKPLTKDEVLELAEAIAASIKPRPVQ